MVRKYDDDDMELWGNSFPICPHCGHEQETTELNSEFEDFQDDEVIKTECDSCDEDFYIQLNMPVRYNTFVDMD
jgi:hypothetical protein